MCSFFKIKRLPVIFLFTIYFIMFSCGKKIHNEVKFDTTVYKPSISSGFEIKTDGNSGNSLIQIINPWQGADFITKNFLIVRNGDKPSGYNGQYVLGDINRIVCMSSTHIGMIEALGETDKIVGVSGMPFISNQYIREHESTIPDIGYEGNMDYETLAAINPDLVLLFSINGESSMEKKLEELGIPYLYIGDYLEEDPLGKAEWIIPIAEVLGKRETGIEIFNEISQRYNSLKYMVEEANLGRPKVMLNAPIGDSWFMPSKRSYVARMMKDAGADYVYKKDTGSTSLPIDMEEAYKNIETSDFWINPGTISNLSELKTSLPKFKDTKPVRNGNVYNNNRILSSGGGNDCYESGVMNPDLILKDLIKIFHPELIEDDFTYYHKLK